MSSQALPVPFRRNRDGKKRKFWDKGEGASAFIRNLYSGKRTKTETIFAELRDRGGGPYLVKENAC